MPAFAFGEQPTEPEKVGMGVTRLVNAIADVTGLERSQASTGVGSVGSLLGAGVTSDGVSAAVALQRSIAEREAAARQQLAANRPVMGDTDP